MYHNGRQVNCASGDYETLTEMATICSMCNDSAVDFNEVTCIDISISIQNLQVHSVISSKISFLIIKLF